MKPNIYKILKENPQVYNIIVDKIYKHGEAPQNVLPSYLTWFIVTGVPENNISDAPNIDFIKAQIDIYTNTDSELTYLYEAVRNALEPYSHLVNFMNNSRDIETRLFSMTLEFDFWLER